MKLVLLATVSAPAFSLNYLESLNGNTPPSPSGAGIPSSLGAMATPAISSPAGAGITSYTDALYNPSSATSGAGIFSYTNSISGSAAPAADDVAPETVAAAPVAAPDDEPVPTALSDLNDITCPNPHLNALDVVTICMNAMTTHISSESLEINFNFSNDRCRAAVGGSLEEFMQYAANPVFAQLVNCGDYKIINIGPMIAGGQQRGEMQTVLVEIKKGITVKDAVKAGVEMQRRKRPSIEERLRDRELEKRGNTDHLMPFDDGTRRFLWTLQKERRPPRQNCWLVHEVLCTKYSFQQTE